MVDQRPQLHAHQRHRQEHAQRDIGNQAQRRFVFVPGYLAGDPAGVGHDDAHEQAGQEVGQIDAGICQAHSLMVSPNPMATFMISQV